jgi:UDP-2-acetamido-2-deoxy-ribo-hexuluronate aminotransferase
LACDSSFPSKRLTGYGNGGACSTDDAAAAALRQIMTHHGQDQRYSHVRLGINERLDSTQAAVLLAKLDMFHDEVTRGAEITRQHSADLMAQGVLMLGDPGAGLQVPQIAPHNTSAYRQ